MSTLSNTIAERSSVEVLQIGGIVALMMLSQAGPARGANTGDALPQLDAVTVTSATAGRALPPSLNWLSRPDDARQRGITLSAPHRDELDSIQAQSVEDLTGLVPGLLPGMANGGLSSALQVRGFALGRLHWNGLPDMQRLYARDLATVERVAVLRGPDAVLHGITAPGGVVHYIGKQALSQPHHLLETSIADGGFWRVEADTTGPLGKGLAYRLVGARQDGETSPGKLGLARWHGLAALSWQYRPGGLLTMEHETQHNQRPFDFGTVVAAGKVRYDQAYQSPAQTSRRRYNQSALRWQDEIAPWLTLSISYAHATVGRDETLFGFWSLIDDRSLSGYYTDYRDRYRQNAWRAEMQMSFDTGPLAHHLALGRDDSRHRIRFDGIQNIAGFNLDIEHPDFDNVDLETLAMSPRYNRERHHEHAWFIADHIDLNDKLGVTLGWRRQAFSTAADRTGAGLLQASAGQGDAWHAGLTAKLGTVHLHLTRSSGLEPNRGMTRDGGFLAPQRSEQLELGASWRHEGTAQVSGAIYQIDLDNLPMPDPLDRNAQVSSGKRRAQGLELSAQRNLGWGKVSFHGNWLDTRNLTKTATDQGDNFTGVPRFTGALRLHAHNILPGVTPWQGWLMLLHVGDRYGDPANSFKVAGYQRVDVGASMPLAAGLLRIGIRNLTNKRYVAVSNNASDIHQGAVRSLWASLQLTM